MTNERAAYWIDLVSTVLLALATVATAWAGYQSSRWHGEQASAQSRATAARVEATRASGVANREAEIDVELFIQWIDAYALKESELGAFYQRRFRDEFKPAFQAWIATKPLTNPDAPLSPFAMPEYKPGRHRRGRATGGEGDGRRRGRQEGHRARRQLRAGRRPVRILAVLRRHQHEAEDAVGRRRRSSVWAACSSPGP